jgi:hypothetical protein
MKLRKKISLTFFVFWLNIKEIPAKTRRWVWNKHLLLWWYRLWIRRDEFHSSLNMDLDAMLEMNEKEMERYSKDLIKRRLTAERAANQRDFGEA